MCKNYFNDDCTCCKCMCKRCREMWLREGYRYPDRPTEDENEMTEVEEATGKTKKKKKKEAASAIKKPLNPEFKSKKCPKDPLKPEIKSKKCLKPDSKHQGRASKRLAKENMKTKTMKQFPVDVNGCQHDNPDFWQHYDHKHYICPLIRANRVETGKKVISMQCIDCEKSLIESLDEEEKIVKGPSTPANDVLNEC